MVDKIKTLLTIALIVIVIFAFGYSLVKLIIKAFEEPTLITIENLNDYALENNIIKDYHTYYHYERCVANIIEACEKELYNDLYNIYISDYASSTNKEQIINNLKDIKLMLTPKDMDEQITYALDKLYYNGNEYLAKVSINENTIYFVFREATAKELSYNFALVK